MSYSLQNVSWQSNPIALPEAFACLALSTICKDYERDADLGRKTVVEGYLQDSTTNAVFGCAKENNNKKLMEVAKKCQGKWF